MNDLKSRVKPKAKNKSGNIIQISKDLDRLFKKWARAISLWSGNNPSKKSNSWFVRLANKLFR